ncbi:MAG: extracellular solute-binding protein, partial [Anaerolineae bacterium]|nr:extracellular solute-binding protein [Anaerolineae bacterium]
MHTRQVVMLWLLALGLAGSTSTASSQANQVTLVFSDWHLTEAHWEATLRDAFVQFEQAHPNISIELDCVTYETKDARYEAEIEAGVGPDVLHLHAYALRAFIERGYLLDLTGFIQAEDPDFLDAWYPQTLEFMQAAGHYYALPGDFMAMVLFYNQRLFTEAGLPPDA